MCNPWEVRRTRDGTIDIAFYAARARRLRMQAHADLEQFIRDCLHATFRWVRAWSLSSSDGKEPAEVSSTQRNDTDQ